MNLRKRYNGPGVFVSGKNKERKEKNTIMISPFISSFFLDSASRNSSKVSLGKQNATRKRKLKDLFFSGEGLERKIFGSLRVAKNFVFCDISKKNSENHILS